MILPDINLLVYSYNTDAPDHSSARQWWENLMNGHVIIGLPWVVSLGFVRIMTNKRVLERPFTTSEALEHVASWMDRPQVQTLHPGPRHLNILRSFAEQKLLSSALTTDAHLAAMAIEVNAEIHSNDADFLRFPGLRCENPLLT